MQYLQKLPTPQAQEHTVHLRYEASWSKLGDLLPKLREMTASISRENYILERLKFPAIHSREDGIQGAADGTFEWMVQEDEKRTRKKGDALGLLSDGPWLGPTSNEEDIRQDTRKSFLTWLNSGNHIFHIAGKAGAGKSTMMKLLSQSPRVQEELRAWSCEKPLIFASFYLWGSGDRAQMSLEGLYRGLLFVSFQAHPELIPRGFPEVWKSLQTGACHPQLRFNDIEGAFTRLIKEISVTHRICFFIDGLDELEGDEVDHWRTARTIRSWTESGNVKVCVSSRPYVPFLHSFATDEDTQIHIHHLTRGDIHKFSLHMFQTDPNFDQINDSYEYLAHEVGRLSNGVFLWARLVVRSLLKGIGYRATREELERKLYAMPKGLEELFDQLLGFVDTEDRVLSAKLFLIATPGHFLPSGPSTHSSVTASPMAPVKNPLIYLWLQGLDDPKFPKNQSMCEFSNADIQKRIQDVTFLLDRSSRGLLEVTHRPSEKDEFFAFELQFFHRTACDYIYKTLLPRMLTLVPGFDVNIATIRLLLAEFKCARPSASDFEHSRGNKYWKPSSLLLHFKATFDWMSAIHKAGCNIPSVYLEEFGHVLKGYYNSAQAFKWSGTGHEGIIWGSKMVTLNLIPEVVWCGRPISYICWIVRFGLEDCLRPEALETLQREIQSGSKVNLLLTASICNRVGLVRRLIREGRTPCEIVPVFLRGFRGLTADGFTDRYATTSIWLVFVWNFAVHQLKSHVQEESSLILEEFLNHGVDTDVQFVMRSSVAELEARQLDGHDGDDKVFVASLLDLITLRQLPNAKALLKKLKPNDKLWKWVATQITDRTVIATQQLLPGIKYERLTLELVDLHPDLYLDRIIARSDRLDAHFRFELS